MARKAPPKLVVGDEDEAGDQNLPEVIDEDDDQGGMRSQASNGADHTETLEEVIAQRDAAREAARVAEERASLNAKKAQQATTSQYDSDKAAIENAIAKEEADKRETISKIVVAKEAGDYATEVELTDKLNQANIKISRLGEGRNEIERRIEDEKNLPADPIEAYVTGMAPRSASWIRNHRDVLTDANGNLDPRKVQKIEDAHFDAIDEKLTPGTRSYFNFIEKRVGVSGGNDAEREEPRNNQQEERPVRREQPTPAAPVSRTSSSNSRLLPAGVEQLTDGKYRLSPARREAARISGQTDAEYLDNLLSIERDRANGTIN